MQQGFSSDAIGDISALMFHAIGNGYRTETHVNQQGDAGMPQIVNPDPLYAHRLGAG